MASHIRKGDMVVITAGDLHARYPSNPGQRSGKVLRVLPGKDRVIVEHPELVARKYVRPSQKNPQGGVVDQYRSIHISNVSPLVDGKATRVRFEKREDGSKVRLAVSNGQQIGQPLRKARRK